MQRLKARQQSYYLIKLAKMLSALSFRKRFIGIIGVSILSFLVSPYLTLFVLLIGFLIDKIFIWVLIEILNKKLEKSILPFLYLLRSFLQSGLSLPAAILEISKTSHFLFARYLNFYLKRFYKGRILHKLFGLYPNNDWQILFKAHLKGVNLLPILNKIIFFRELEVCLEQKITQVKKSAYIQIAFSFFVPIIILGTLYFFQYETFQINSFFKILFAGFFLQGIGLFFILRECRFYKKKSQALILKQLIQSLTELHGYVLYGFDLRYSWFLLKNKNELGQELFCFSQATIRKTELKSWVSLILNLYNKGLSVSEPLENCIKSLSHQLEREVEQYNKKVPVKINALLTLFYLPVVFLWLYYPLLSKF